MSKKALMFQGTMSGAGKSTLVAGVCRALFHRGIRVAPFKPQNMALNSAVTVDGGEIGRAQAVQALACGLEPHVDMNPVLLKPQTDVGAQVIINGRAVGSMSARAYHAYKPTAMEQVLAAYERLQRQYDAVIIEGAGSPAEINLRDKDIANMGFAEAVDCPVVLIGDIDRGGVFAQFAGTLQLLSASERERVRGLVVNQFRGDLALLQPGLDWLTTHSGKAMLGVLPYLTGLHIDAEDAVDRRDQAGDGDDRLQVVVPRLPRISNHTDFDALRLHPQVEVHFVAADVRPPAADLIVLPGSKAVASDLAWLRQQGWEATIRRHLRYGGKLIGICGGFQMLGNTLNDPTGIEGLPGSHAGLGLLEFDTTLEAEKQLHERRGRLALEQAEVRGYEIHMGVSHGPALNHPAIQHAEGCDGALSRDGQILGSYFHGLFDSAPALAAILRWAGQREVVPQDMHALRLAHLDRLADAVETHLDLEQMLQIIG